jgi:hypothetical protein
MARIIRTCDCGSGLEKFPQNDARAIFLCYTCDKCHDRKMGRYRKDVLADSNYWHDEPIDSD